MSESLSAHRRALVPALAALAAFGAAAACPAAALATFPGANGDLLWSQTVSALTPPKGSALLRSTPAGPQLVLRQNDDSGQPSAIGTRYSPDGRRTLTQTSSGLWTATPEGTDLQRVPLDQGESYASQDGAIQDATWLADGSIAFTRGNGASGDAYATTAWAVQLDGSGLRRLDGVSTAPETVSPDGGEFAWSRLDGDPAAGGTVRIFTQRADGAAPPAAVAGTGSSYDPDYSPDGRYLLFKDPTGVQALERATGVVRTVIDDVLVSAAHFSPDCTAVGYRRFDGGVHPILGQDGGANAYVMRLATGQVVPIASTIEAEGAPSWVPVPGPAAHCDLSRFPLRGAPRATPRPQPTPPLIPAAPRDLVAPVLKLRALRTPLLEAPKAGLAVRYATSEASSVTIDLQVGGKRVPRPLHKLNREAAGEGRSLVGLAEAVPAGRHTTTLPLRPRLLRALRRLPSGRFTVRVVATDMGGNPTTATQPITLR